MSSIGKEIKRLREEKGLSQAELAVYAGSSQPTVNQIESGKRNPSTRTLEKLAGALEVEVADLFPKDQASLPFEESPVENSAERRDLIPLFDSYTLILTELSNGHESRIANLTEDFPPSKVLAIYQWVCEFIYTCDLIQHALDKKGITEIAGSLEERAAQGEYVPAEILHRVDVFQHAWSRLFIDVWTSANDWVQSQYARPEVVEYAERERARAQEELGEPESNVVSLFDPDREQRREKRRNTRREETG